MPTKILRYLFTAYGMMVSQVSLAEPSPPHTNDARKSPLLAPLTERRPVVGGGVYSPYNDQIPQQVYWGDTHLHSSLSVDAASAGNQRLSPAEAYRFARGEKVMANSGQEVRLNRPLDFLVVADHAEYLGLMRKIMTTDPSLESSEGGRKILNVLMEGRDQVSKLAMDVGLAFIDSDNRYPTPVQTFNSWKASTATADYFNEPGKFTALIGYEWTYFPQGDNLHRVVIYKDGAEKAAAMPPFSALDGKEPEQLWAFMADYEQQTGGEILAIPHNANVSNGRMFTLEKSSGEAIDANYSKTRVRWEPLIEVTQIKGDGEAHPLLSPDDEFADFENWDKGNLNPFGQHTKTTEMLTHEYARSALKLGLEAERLTGINPFQFGMIGSTDAHTSLATAEENNYWGKVSALEPGNERSKGIFFPSENPSKEATFAWEQVAAGYAAVWAVDNTRESLFAAMKRKEVYATTGPRMSVRFFAGWHYQDNDAFKPDSARIGYAGGVPMGGELNYQSSTQKPRFLVTAIKDINGANLDRIQIVKGWQDEHGKLHEKVYNVAVSRDRKIRRNGSVRPVKSTVSFNPPNYINTVGDAQLATVWEDPDFDHTEAAFYYARVLEIPTPRWTEYDKEKFGYQNTPKTPREIQDRAYTSPIWYKPEF